MFRLSFVRYSLSSIRSKSFLSRVKVPVPNTTLSNPILYPLLFYLAFCSVGFRRPFRNSRILPTHVTTGIHSDLFSKLDVLERWEGHRSQIVGWYLLTTFDLI
ncbi:hypothetical protein BDW71DRAFT_746 [Aspergillus fruticulosus]